MNFLNKVSPKWLRASVYGANDGIVTTFAVVAGVSGAGLSANIILILGVANMIADGLSMGFGDYLGERAEQKLRQQRKQTFNSSRHWETGLITFISFVIAGSLPLLPYVFELFGVVMPGISIFLSSIVATGSALFLVGSLRVLFTKEHWFKSGLEMLGVGAIAAIMAYILGSVIEKLT
jgi:vacuolar iron transporter family protein